MSRPQLKDCSKLLIVEGYSDLLFYAEFLEHLKNLNGVYIHACNGKADLVQQIEVFLTPELLREKTSIAIVVDADVNPVGTVQSLEQQFSDITGIAVKNEAWTQGAHRLGLFVVPGSGDVGEIESLVWRSWSSDPANATFAKCVESYLQCVQAVGSSPRSPDKARISALLAIKNDEDARLGPGAQRRVFDFDRPSLSNLANFLRQL